MKVTPVAGGAGGTTLGSINAIGGSSVSQERREAAKQVFLGQTKLTPSDTPVDPQVTKAQESIRKIKMRTNATPGQYDQGEEQITSATQDQVVQTEPIVEATTQVDPQLAAIAKQKRALLVKESELLAKEKALASQPAQVDYVAKLKANPLSVLQEAGVTYEQLTEAILNDQSGVNPTVQALQAEVKALKEGLDNKFNERDQQAEQQVLSEMRRELDKLVGTGDEFETVRETKSQKDVIELIHRTWKQTGEVLDVSEAAALVEDQLVKDYSKLASLKKIQSQFTQVQQPLTQQQPRQQMRTLTNRDTATRPMSAKARALAAFYGTLKK